jgi:hypothetical protein
MVQQLMAREVSLIEQVAKRPASEPVLMPWMPRKKIPDAYNIKDYVMSRVEPPRGSAIGEHAHGVAAGKSETTRDIISYRYTYTINKTDLRIASRNGYDIIGQNVAMLRQAMEETILTLVFQGTGALTTTDLPDISGMFDVGEDVDAALDGEAWDTATKPLVHAKAGFSDLVANNYFPPYTWILSRNLQAGNLALNNAAEPASHEEIAKRTYLQGGGVYYYRNGTSAYGAGGYTIYPLQAAAADDGVWCMFSNSNGRGEQNFYLAEVTDGIETDIPNTLDENNNYTIGMEWRGTPVFRLATVATAGSAPYIVFEPDVDLA